MGTIACLDAILVPFSLFLMLGYHAYLWRCFKNNPSHSPTTTGIDALRRKGWVQSIIEGGDKKGMLLVQSLRNAQMTAIFTASIAILLNLSLAALDNNSYKASHLLVSAYFGSHTGRIYALKLGSASLFLLISFLCSSMGLVFLIDANFLIRTSHEFSSPTYTHKIFERAFMLTLIGNRVLCMSFPMVIWTFGPVPVALSSMALVWGLYELDFSCKISK